MYDLIKNLGAKNAAGREDTTRMIIMLSLETEPCQNNRQNNRVNRKTWRDNFFFLFLFSRSRLDQEDIADGGEGLNALALGRDKVAGLGLAGLTLDDDDILLLLLVADGSVVGSTADEEVLAALGLLYVLDADVDTLGNNAVANLLVDDDTGRKGEVSATRWVRSSGAKGRSQPEATADQ